MAARGSVSVNARAAPCPKKELKRAILGQHLAVEHQCRGRHFGRASAVVFRPRRILADRRFVYRDTRLPWDGLVHASSCALLLRALLLIRCWRRCVRWYVGGWLQHVYASSIELDPCYSLSRVSGSKLQTEEYDVRSTVYLELLRTRFQDEQTELKSFLQFSRFSPPCPVRPVSPSQPALQIHSQRLPKVHNREAAAQGGNCRAPIK